MVIKKKFMQSLIFQALFIVLVFASPAHAYLDPGTGSVILQGVIAGIAAIAFAVKIYWHRLLQLLGLRKKTDFDDSVSDSSGKKNN